MNIRTFILFIIPTLIWGSTWFAIKFQLGQVDPLLSVSWRFLLAGFVLLAYCKIKKLNLRFKAREHGLMALLGLTLFGVNYWMVYEAETRLASGLVAILFSLIIFANIFFNALLLKGQIRKEVVFGAILGILGTVLMFFDELLSFYPGNQNFIALLLCIFGVVLASLGNITSAYNQKKKLPVLQTNAFAMIYGGSAMFITVLAIGKPISFDFSAPYIISLSYLSVFGSIVAFSVYLKLLGEIGPDRSAYIALITPVIALFISTFFEGYQWKVAGVLGVILLLAGNVFALKSKLVKKRIKA
ncbi:DMT family transporter [Sunxiuqinia sp. A32]|uniref:DMT family transporter n=1 Tax=Sunxiuqinia sp. A32 TaxID=3461496 RepID=UPI0040456F38